MLRHTVMIYSTMKMANPLPFNLRIRHKINSIEKILYTLINL